MSQSSYVRHNVIAVFGPSNNDMMSAQYFPRSGTGQGQDRRPQNPWPAEGILRDGHEERERDLDHENTSMPTVLQFHHTIF